jgi:2'-5' RNA ligase
LRMFTAVVPPDDVIEGLDEFLEPRRDATERPTGDLRRPPERLRWTRPESWHLTLGFMASVPERSLEDLLERLERAAHRRTPFELAIAGGGAFPNVGRAKLLYAAVEGADTALEELSRLATGARAAAGKAGAPADGSAFRPHLTLARMRHPVEATRWVRVLSTCRSRPFLVEELVLVQSHLGEGPRNRPRYETVATFPLGPEEGR